MIRTFVFFSATCLFALALSAPVQASEEGFKKAGCAACHAADKKVLGPSLKDVATKYKGQPDALAKLSDKVRKGGAGAWGPIPMPPHDAAKVSDADLKAIVQWILAQ